MGKCILILSLTLLLFGCQQINEEKADNTDSVESISIYKMIGFSEIIEESLNVITDSEEINSIEEIIKGAEKVAGIVDVFDPHYQVEIGGKTYYLWIHNKEAATIMDEEDTRTVYKISGNLVERLIEVIR